MSVPAFPTTDLHPATRPAPARRRHLVAVPAGDVPVGAPAAPRRRAPLALVRPLPLAPLPERTVDALTAPGAGSPALAPARDLAPVSSAAHEAPMRLTARGRRVLVVLAFVVAAAVGAISGTLLGGDVALPTSVETVTVQPGESLWSIASTVTAPGADVRVVVDQIMALNGLDDSVVATGERLAVPAS